MTSPHRYFLILLYSAISITVRAQQNPNSLTLQQCIDIATKNNLNVKQTGLTMDQDRINYNQAKENLLPTISGEVDHGLTQGRGINPSTNTYLNQSFNTANYGLSAGVTLFNGLAYQNAIKQASLAYQAGKMDFQQAKDVVTIQVITNYLQVLDNGELLAQAVNQLDVAQKSVGRSEILEKDGANKSPLDLYNLRGTLASSRVAVVNYKNSLEAAKLSLFQLMNIPYNRNVELQPLNAEELKGQHDISPDLVYAAALQLPGVKAAELRRQSAESAVKVAKGNLLPYITLGAGLSTNYSSTSQRSVFTDSTSVPTGLYTNGAGGKQPIYTTQANYTTQNYSYYDQLKNNYGTGVTLGLHIPILGNFIRRNAVSTAKINLLISKNIEDNTKVLLQQNVEQAYLNMTSAYDRYQALVDQVNAYKESFRIAQIQFDAGLITSVDYIIAKNNLDGANINLISARYDYFIGNKILDYYQGRLTTF